jgi:hypothetical protein
LSVFSIRKESAESVMLIYQLRIKNQMLQNSRRQVAEESNPRGIHWNLNASFGVAHQRIKARGTRPSIHYKQLYI